MGVCLPKILFFVAEDWNVVSHFLPLIREAIANGLEPVVATRVQNHRAQIEAEGARVVALTPVSYTHLTLPTIYSV